MNQLILTDESIKRKIYTIRGVQVMFDSDLADIYDVEIKRFNEQVKRNIDRFPDNFMFQLTKEEFDSLRSQIVISNSLRSQNVTLDRHDSLRSQIATLDRAALRSQNVTLDRSEPLRSQNATSETARGRHRKYVPYVFTEQGVSMLSGVLKSDTAVKVSIQIMNAFVVMRRFIAKNAGVFARLDNVERKQLEFEIKTEDNFRKVFDALQVEKPRQGIFYDGQVFDAYQFVSDLVRSASKSIILIDNYIDDTTLTLFSKRRKDVSVIIYTKKISDQLRLDLNKFNLQYDKIDIKEFVDSHDRFIIIDSDKIYHFGASLKDVGKKWFAFSKFDKGAVEMLSKLG